jgi:two-component system sensor histidine kinase MtrB
VATEVPARAVLDAARWRRAGARLVVPLRHALRSAGPAFVRGARALGHTWAASLQLRVAATTLVVTGAVVLVIGTFLVDQIGAGVLRAKREAAITQAELGLPAAQTLLGAPESGDIAGILDAVDRTKLQLSANGGTAGLFTLAVETPSAAANAHLSDVTAIDPEMRRDVQRGNLVVQYAPLKDDRRTVSGLIVGEPVAARAGTFELYYMFPLVSEQETLALVRRTVAFAGLALMLLVLAIALLVTRQVVRPVRVAAQTAVRLSEGDLAQRIRVRGSDDLARLGRSFNEMAESLQRQIRRLEELSRLQRRFTSDVSHELRTPLTTIRMATELLHAQRREFPPELSRSVELLNAELDRFEALLADLLEISRFDAGVARLEADTYDLRTVVTNAVEASEVLAERHGSDVLVDLPDEPLPVEMDPRRIERILRNLLGNALDHG